MKRTELSPVTGLFSEQATAYAVAIIEFIINPLNFNEIYEENRERLILNVNLKMSIVDQSSELEMHHIPETGHSGIL